MLVTVAVAELSADSPPCSTPELKRAHACFDPMMEATVKLAENKTGIVLDVGANGGFQSWTAFNLGRRVYAVECLASAYASLLEMFAAVDNEQPSCSKLALKKKIADPNAAFECTVDDSKPSVSVLHACAANETGMARLHLAADSSSLRFHSVIVHQAERVKAKAELGKTGRSSELELTVRLDSLFLDTPVAVLKVDTQGTEYGVISGASELLARWRPIVMYEYAKDFGPQAGRAYSSVLAPLGYACHRGSGEAKHDVLCATNMDMSQIKRAAGGLHLVD